jgi:hypothetical protein
MRYVYTRIDHNGTESPIMAIDSCGGNYLHMRAALVGTVPTHVKIREEISVGEGTPLLSSLILEWHPAVCKPAHWG